MIRWLQVALTCASLLLCAHQTLAKDSQHGPWGINSVNKAYKNQAFIQFIEDREHISIIEFSGNYQRTLADDSFNFLPRAEIAKEFYAHHPDDYDFLIVFSTFEFDTGEALAFHVGIQNQVEGIGLPLYDDTALFGSNSRLQGFIDMAAMTRYELDRLRPEFDFVLGVMAHEIMHQWGAFVHFQNDHGNASAALLGRNDSHWSFLLDSDASLMYGNDWTLNGDGSFTSIAARLFYSPLDLYLAGFYAAHEVPAFNLIANPAVDKNRLPERHVTIDGIAQIITVDDIIALEGVRIPDKDQAQKEFRSAFILLTQPNETVSDEQLFLLNNVREEFPTRFSILTGGRGVMQVYPEALSTERPGSMTPLPGDDDIRPGAANISDALAWLRAQQHSDGYWQDLAHTSIRDTVSVLETLTRLDPDFTNADTALNWLKAQDNSNVDYLARTTLALNKLGLDTDALRQQLLAQQNSDGGWGLASGYGSDSWDTALAIFALAAATGDSTVQLQNAIHYLQQQQTEDGSWGNVNQGPGRTALAATVLYALAKVDAVAAENNTAITWLAARQQPDGGFGDDDSTVLDTVLVLRALVELNAVDTIASEPAVNYLRAQQTVSGSWDGSTYTTALVVLLLKQFVFPNWAIDDPLIITPIQPRDGERVVINITVRNDGSQIAPSGVLRLYDAPPAAGGQAIGTDLQIPVLGPQQTATFNPLWDTLNQAGERTLVAIVDPDQETVELSELDNQASVSFTVQEPPSVAELELRDSDITITPAQPHTLPAELAISATLRNLGEIDANNVRVILQKVVASHTDIVDEQTITIAQRSSIPIHFTYTLTSAGNTDFIIQIDPDNQITEADETNNSAKASVVTQASIDLTVSSSDIVLLGDSANLGHDATFQVQLHNQGTVDAPATPVRYWISNDSESREVGFHTVQLNAGETLTQNIVWRTDLSGDLTFQVDIDPDNSIPEGDENNNQAGLDFSASVIEQANLVIDYRDLSFDPEPALQGQALTMTAIVRNTGGVAVTNAEIGFYQNEVAPEQLFGIRTIAQLNAGDAAPVRLEISSLPGGEDRLIYVVADPANGVAEYSENDNRAFHQLPVQALADLALSPASLILNPRFPSPGQAVNLTVNVVNLGEQTAEDIAVRVFTGDPESGGITLAPDQNIEQINGGGEAQIDFTWQYTEASESQLLVVQVDPDDHIMEIDSGNNQARLNIAVQDANAFVSERYFSPNGDSIQDTTQLFFRLDQPADVQIEIRDQRDQIVRRYRSPDFNQIRDGYIEWDGLNDYGSVVRDGDYRLQIVAAAGTILGEALTTLDTNRSSLLEAAGTVYESINNLSCELPDIKDLQLSEDESSFFFIIEDSNQDAFADGIYRMSGSGGAITNLIPSVALQSDTIAAQHIETLKISDDGSRLAFISEDEINGSSERKLWLANDRGDTEHYDAVTLSYRDEIIDFIDNNRLLIKQNENLLLLTLDHGFTPPQTLYSAVYDRIENFILSPDKHKLVLRDVASDASPGPGKVVIIDLLNQIVMTLLDITSFSDDIPSFLLWRFNSDPEFAWSSDGHYLAVSDVVNRSLSLFDSQGNKLQTYSIPAVDSPFSDYLHTTALHFVAETSAPQWSGSGTELAITLKHYYTPEADAEGGYEELSYQQILIFNRLNGEFTTIDWSEPSDYSVFPFDAESGDFGLLPSFGDILWGPNERVLLYGLSADDDSAHDDAHSTAIWLDENNRRQELFSQFNDLHSSRFIPSGRFLLFNSDDAQGNPDSPCYQNSSTDTLVFRSLANMTADLQPRRSSTLGGILLEGTAADLNFANYRLDYALSTAPEQWLPVMPVASQPLIAGRFTTWVPPAPGTYRVRLTMNDLAGNQRQVIQRVSWFDTPSISDLYREPAYVSPNGDGVQDHALIHYRVLEPVHLVFQFYNSADDLVRTVERSHDQIGSEHELIWDGRDDEGLIVADGEYRVVVQNFELFIHIDNTAPAAEIYLNNGFIVTDCSVCSESSPEQPYQIMSAVSPKVYFEVNDANLVGSIRETGEGTEPLQWFELDSRPLSLDRFVNHRFRVRVEDSAGNKTVVTSPLSAEEIIVTKVASQEVPAESEPYAIDIGEVGDIPEAIRLNFSETIRAEALQLFVQYRRSSQQTAPWLDIELTSFASEHETITTEISDHSATAIWSIPELSAGVSYEARLKQITAEGEYFSNIFQFNIFQTKAWFLGDFNYPSAAAEAEIPLDLGQLYDELFVQAFTNTSPDPGSLLLWMVDDIAEPFAEMILEVSSSDDPRYFVAQWLTPIAMIDGAALFELQNPLPCATYSGVINATTITDSNGGFVVYSGKVPDFSLDCLEISAVVTVPEFGTCNEAISQQNRFVDITATSLNGVELVLLTLAKLNPDGSEDIHYSLSQPLSGQTYTAELDLQDFAEGIHPFIARITNGEGNDITAEINIVIDHSPPLLEITYPQPELRLCGTPREIDGELRTVLDFEGVIEDQSGFFYQLEIDTPLSTNFTALTLDRPDQTGNLSLPTCYGNSERAREALTAFSQAESSEHCSNVHGPLAIYGNVNTEPFFSGSASARLHVYDFGGFHACTDVTFSYDGEIEGAEVSVNNPYFSVQDELAIQISSDEAATVAVEIRTAEYISNELNITETVVRQLIEAAPVVGSLSTSWDGLDEAGQIVSEDGDYAVVVSFTDACGNYQQQVEFFTIDITPPQISIDYPQSGDPLPLIVEVYGSVYDDHLQHFELAFGEGDNPLIWSSLNDGQYTIDNDLIAVWDTFGLNGLITLRLSATDKAGNSTEIFTPLLLDTPTELITGLQTSARIFSPNNDQLLDKSRISFILGASVNIDLIVFNEQDFTVRHLLEASEYSRGSASVIWDGLDDNGNPLQDGTYTARLQVRLTANLSVSEQAEVSIIIDNKAPAVVLNTPQEYASNDTAILGTVNDPHLDNYQLSITTTPDTPVWQEIDSGNNNRIDYAFARLNNYPEGAYAVKLAAWDEADNYAEHIVAFTLDNTPPQVDLTAPVTNSLLSTVNGPVTITANVVEENLAEYRLEVSHEHSSEWSMLDSGTELNDVAYTSSWNIGSLADGVYQIRFTVTDLAGLVRFSELSVNIDNTPPQVAITSPQESDYISGPNNIIGTVSDHHLSTYQVAIAPGNKQTATQWSALGQSSQSVSNGVLLDWQALPPDGLYTLRLSAKDRAGNTSAVLIELNVDTTPPQAPVNLSAETQNQQDVYLYWSANSEPDLAGYKIYRNGVLLNAGLITALDYLDSEVSDGPHQYTMSAVDQAGLESLHSTTVTITVNTSAPTTIIYTPKNNSRVGGLLDITGTAHSQDDFKEYRLYSKPEGTNDADQLLRRSPVAVQNNVLVQWDTFTLVNDSRYLLRLESEDIHGNEASAEVAVIIDNDPPAAPANLNSSVKDNNITLHWDDNTEADLSGYLVFRDGQLVNADNGVTGNLSPYVITQSTYLDQARPDGTFVYEVYAIDQAGNLSGSSEPIQVTIDQRPPQAVIITPVDGHRFEHSLFIKADTTDTDIAEIQFQYKAAAANGWSDLGSADVLPPWETTWDLIDLPYGDYQLRAVATDHSDLSDPAAAEITVIYMDLDQPQSVQGLQVQVDADRANLIWQPGAEHDLAGYHIERRNEQITDIFSRITSVPVTESYYQDNGLADGIYQYIIIAVDQFGNEAEPSGIQEAEIYTPELVHPYTPTQALTTNLSGSGVANAQVVISIEDAGSQMNTISAISDADGGFISNDIALTRGENTLSVQFTDNHGNISKPATVTIVSAAVPAAPTGLNATLLDPATLELDWDANTEPDILGYRIFRNGEPLLADTPASVLYFSASSEWSYSTEAYSAIDGDDASYWAPQVDDDQALEDQWLELTLTDTGVISTLQLNWQAGYATADYDVQAWNNGTWINIAQIRNHTDDQHDVSLAQPYRSDRLRLVLLRSSRPEGDYQPVRLTELKIYQRPYQQVLNFTDHISDGIYAYTVTALNQYAFESLSSNTASIASGDTEPPEPVVISAEVIAADVILSWGASSSADVARYDIYRDGEKIAEQNNLEVLTYTDADQPNGDYLYTIAAVDYVGNVSVLSNEVSVTISGDPLPRPTQLIVSSVDSGSALSLSWQAGSANFARYWVQRAVNSGGPYQTVATTTTTHYVDNGLTNGTVYYYVVIGLDSAGNQSPASAEASGIPGDFAAPNPPVLYYPASPEQPLQTHVTVSDISGTTEPGAVVDLYRNNRWLGNVYSSEDVTLDSTELDGWNFLLSPDGRYLISYDYWEARLYDYLLEKEQRLPLQDLEAIAWEARQQLIYSDGYELKRYHLDSGQIETLASADTFLGIALAPNGEYLAALAELDSNTGLYLLNLSQSSWRLITSDNGYSIRPESLRWSKDSGQLGFHHYNGTLELFDLAEDSLITVDDQALSTISWSPDSRAFSYFAENNNNSYLYRYRVADAVADAFLAAPEANGVPQWSPDGDLIAFATATGDVFGYRLADSSTEKLLSPVELAQQALYDARLQWVQGGHLLLHDDSNQYRLTLPGYFRFPSVALDDGDNVFSARAEDIDGNLSVRSQIIKVTVDVEDRPDLAIKADSLVVLPAIAQTGSAVKASVTITNAGAQASPAAAVSFIVQGPNGYRHTLAEGMLLPALSPGNKHTISRNFIVPDDDYGVGTYSFVAVVDPQAQLAEVNETNNYAQYPLLITADANPVISITLPRQIYLNHQSVTGIVEVINPGEPFTGNLHLQIEDEDNFEVAQLSLIENIQLAFNESRIESASWNSADIFAGHYHLRATLENSQGSWQQTALADFSIAERIELQSQIRLEQFNYFAGDTIEFNALIDYLDGNTAINNALGHFTVFDSNQQQITELTIPINSLLPGQQREISEIWSDPAISPGQYRIHFDVKYDDRILTSSEISFDIVEQIVQFSGTLFLSDPEPTLGDLLEVQYSVENQGNTTIDQLPISIYLRDGSKGHELSTLSDTASLSPGSQHSNTISFATGNLAIKNYLVVLSLQTADSEITLQVDSFLPQDRLAPAVTVISPQPQAFLDNDLSVQVRATDTHSPIRQVEVSIDNGNWLALELSDANEAVYSTQLNFLTDGNHQLIARALDQWDNQFTTSPLQFRVDQTAPIININGVKADEQYTDAVTPIISIDESNPLTHSVTLNGDIFVAGSTISDAGTYTLAVNASDEAGNQAQQSVGFSIQPAAAPLPQLSVDDIAFNEGDHGISSAVFAFQLDKASEQTVLVTYATESLTALANEDFLSATGTLEIEPGQTSAQVQIQILGDQLVEADETFRLLLQNPQGLVLTVDYALALIRNDDSPDDSSPPPPPETPDEEGDGSDENSNGDESDNNAQAALEVTLTDSLLPDHQTGQQASPGDTLRYTLLIKNTGNITLTGVNYQADTPLHTKLISTHIAVDVINHNRAIITHDFADLVPGAEATLIYDVVINQYIDENVLEIRHRGQIHSDQLANTASDDPDTAINDATLTPLFRPVAIPTISTGFLLLLALLLISSAAHNKRRRPH